MSVFVYSVMKNRKREIDYLACLVKINSVLFSFNSFATTTDQFIKTSGADTWVLKDEHFNYHSNGLTHASK